MKIKDLFESPIPDHWDNSVFIGKSSFKARLAYAKKMAQRLGAGSSRVAFEIEYQGRPTILKLAKNKKGLSQNEEEVNILNDYYIRNLEITIPLIDYDERHVQPQWIHTEKAEKMTPTKFQEFFGVDAKTVLRFSEYHIYGKPPLYRDTYIELGKILLENEYVQKLTELIMNTFIIPDDLTRLENWGIYKNHPVVIDLGFTDTSAQLYKLR